MTGFVQDGMKIIIKLNSDLIILTQSYLYTYTKAMLAPFIIRSIKSFCTSKVHQPNFPRHPYKVLNDCDLNYFRSIISDKNILTDSHDVQPYNISILKTEIGNSKLVLLPDTAQQISQILSYCNKEKLAVVPQGGNTGLVGGNTPVFDEIVVSTKNINKIRKFDNVSSVITLDAGCVLQTVNEYLQERKCEFPLDLGAKGTCQVGGNAATGAGGIYMVKHGSYRSYILGMQVILPNGKILDLTSENQKDNTGYDLKQLFIGSQGTLGIITKLNVLCPKFNPQRTLIAFRFNDFSKIIQSIPIIKGKLGKNLNAMEYIDGVTYNVSSKYTGVSLMDKVEPTDHLLLIETTAIDIIEQIFQKLPSTQDAIMSGNQQQFKKMWKVRQSIALAAQKQGRTRAYDISYDVNYWNELTTLLRKKMPDALILSYGHIGDGNIHLNFCHPQAITVNDAQMYKIIVQRKGSISAEHGLGTQKSKYLNLQKSDEIISIFKQIKDLFDPNGIMNPYKMIPI